MNGFHSTAGVTPFELSLAIRIFLCALFLLWAAWNVYGQYQMVVTEKKDFHDLPMVLSRILFLCALVVILVFIK